MISGDADLGFAVSICSSLKGVLNNGKQYQIMSVLLFLWSCGAKLSETKQLSNQFYLVEKSIKIDLLVRYNVKENEM